MRLENTIGYGIIDGWLKSKGYKPFAFQEETWQHILDGRSGLVNAPTGCGKTFSVFLGALIDFINKNPGNFQKKSKSGLQILWVTPLRALAKDIGRAMEEVILELGMNWKVGVRNGDTSISDRQKQKRQMPEVLLITPESLHLLLGQKDYPPVFKALKIIAVDEWHELLGSKRGVQVELGISRIIGLKFKEGLINEDGRALLPSVIGISATIGNLDEAREVLISPVLHYLNLADSHGGKNSRLNNASLAESGLDDPSLAESGVNDTNPADSRLAEASFDNPELNDSSYTDPSFIVKANVYKPIEVESIIPDEIEKYPWAGHLGIRLAEKVLPILEQSTTTLIFINTRGMSEIWYQRLLTIKPELAGVIALHHGSIDMDLRTWVEENLHTGKLKAVVCTASLDLGVDFRPVETVIQVGSPKGVARFLQRAGRSGHQPGQVSKIYFLPTHSLELVEAAALKEAMKLNFIESREPRLLCFDVLSQFLGTLAISDGFRPDEIFKEVKSTFCYRDMTAEEFQEILYFLTEGGNALQQYDEFKKVEIIDGLYKINNRRIAMRHRIHIGTIVSDSMIKVKFMSGGFVGVIEEYFISRLNPGDVFTLAGRNLEFIAIKEMTAIVKKSNAKKSIVPSWNGGRMPLSANLGLMLRKKFNEAVGNVIDRNIGYPSARDVELRALQPLFELQEQLSHIPKENELLLEHIETKDGYHLFVYPFEGRLVHEAMAAILAYRISRITPITFSFAMNDYGFELLSDQPIPVDDTNVYELFSPENLFEDIQRSVNSSEMARRKFRDIAVIGGLIFQGYPGEHKKAKHLQSSASLLYNVFAEYDKSNLLLRQASNEVMEQQMEEQRLRNMLQRIQDSRIVITVPSRLTPFCFPLKVDSMRENMSSEKLEDRVKRMQAQLGS